MLRKIAGPFIIGATLVSFSASAEPNPFTDSAAHWAKESIEKAVGKGYVDGYEDRTFRPDLSVTRAEFVKMVVTALKLSVNGKASDGEWYLPYVNVAVGAGIHRWSDFSSGDWNTPITRQEMSRMIVRATDKELQKPDAAKSDSELMYLAAKAGLIQGLSGGQLGESEATTRAQSVTVIERILTVNGGGKLEVDKHAVNRAELAWHKTNIFTVMPEFFGKVSPTSKWNPDNMFVETPDGNYRGELDALIAIDLDDLDDPHRDMVDISNLKWLNLRAAKAQPVSELKGAYLLYFKSRVVYNHDPQTYSTGYDYMLYSVTGFKPNFEEERKGNLSAFSQTSYQDFLKGKFPAAVISKNAETGDDIFVSIQSSAIPPNNTYDKRLIWTIPVKRSE
ncbi:S-layer homology domain-containing protein [Paenibacillus hemerocallicola]|nr:S-layer homology domain-containing protein [Paenibacillus hemerocallicola]